MTDLDTRSLHEQEHMAALAACPDQVARIRYICELIGPTVTTPEVVDRMARYGYPTGRPYASDHMNRWKRENGHAVTGRQPKMTAKKLAELDREFGRPVADTPPADEQCETDPADNAVVSAATEQTAPVSSPDTLETPNEHPTNTPRTEPGSEPMSVIPVDDIVTRIVADEHATNTAASLPRATEQPDSKTRRSEHLERGATLLTAVIASVVAAQGMYHFFNDKLSMPTPLLLLSFSFIELMVVTSAMRARRSQMDGGRAGVDGIAMWVLTVMSGILAASDAESFSVLLLRLMAPLIAAWGWERSMALERRKLTGNDRSLNWRWSPAKLMVRWGLADPTDRTAAQIATERRLADLARAADALRAARESGKTRRIQRATQRVRRAIDKAVIDGVVLGEPEIRERLIVHLEGLFSSYTLADYIPQTNFADMHRTADVRAVRPNANSRERTA